ncbi:hypothetical protein IQ10_00829 [Halalkalibacter nanhaiisediminis]|uniref:Uncharacterized protein n=1 Tax=Halalkalibacter nanhaiisediminis TaxID=688079 RepID=A0A562QQY1_9BACI|nr:hypothetical protein IQ10_00829 [Halalkalibacter nanhaiisediminis]
MFISSLLLLSGLVFYKFLKPSSELSQFKNKTDAVENYNKLIKGVNSNV